MDQYHASTVSSNGGSESCAHVPTQLHRHNSDWFEVYGRLSSDFSVCFIFAKNDALQNAVPCPVDVSRLVGARTVLALFGD